MNNHYVYSCCCCLAILLPPFLSKVCSFPTGLSSLLGPSDFWCLALPVEVCSLECNDDNNNNDNVSYRSMCENVWSAYFLFFFFFL